MQRSQKHLQTTDGCNNKRPSLIHKEMYTLLASLDEDTRYTLRQTSRTFNTAIQATQRGKLENKRQFVMAFSGYFKPTQHERVNKRLNNAWHYYQTILSSDSFKPASFYKCSCIRFFGEFLRFTEAEPVSDNGRTYCPYLFFSQHSWPLNQVWLLANIHLGRAFTILSDVDGDYVTPSNQLRAFAKEITMTMQAGYTLATTAYNQVQLVPPNSQVLTKTGLIDLECDHLSAINHYQTVMKYDATLFSTRTLATPEEIISNANELAESTQRAASIARAHAEKMKQQIATQTNSAAEAATKAAAESYHTRAVTLENAAETIDEHVYFIVKKVSELTKKNTVATTPRTTSINSTSSSTLFATNKACKLSTDNDNDAEKIIYDETLFDLD